MDSGAKHDILSHEPCMHQEPVHPTHHKISAKICCIAAGLIKGSKCRSAHLQMQAGCVQLRC
jgi:hypothetical protein